MMSVFSITGLTAQTTPDSVHHHPVPPAHSLVFAGDSARATAAGVSARIRSLLDTTTITLDRLEVHKTTLAPGGSPHPPHRHPHEEMMLVEHGTLEVTQEGAVRTAKTGALIFEASGELHGLRNIGADSAVYWVIAIYAPRKPR
jgi:quercetin dioxygenase-like cupin family protein